MAENKKQNTLLHKRSVKKGVLPQGEILQYGEIAVNYNSEEPFLSIRKDGENKEYAKFSADEVIAKMFDEKYVTIEDLEDNEEVIASALNELNDRIESIQGINIGNSKGESSLLQKVEVETFVDENPDSPTNGQEIPTEASGNHSVVLNGKSNASAKRALAHGNRTIAQGENSHTEGHCTQTVCIDEVTNGYAAHAEGYGSMAGGTYSHAEGNKTKTAAPNSHAEGYLSITTPEAESSHAEGYETSTEAPASHTEGNNTKTHKAYSHAEGRQTETFGEASHTEGNETITEGDYAHAEGWMTRAKGAYSHAEGQYTFTYADAAHSEGNNTHAQAPFSHAEGLGTKTNPDIIGQHVEGYYNADSDGVKVIGCGTADDDRINAVEVKQDGRVFVKGLGNFDGTNSNESIDLAGAINNIYDKSETYNKTEIDNRLSTDYYLKSQTNHQISTEINKLATVAKTGFYNDLLDKPTIPSEVTEETVSGWGFTKNKGTVTDVKVNGSSVVDSENGVANITAADLGLSSALKYCGITTTKLTDGDTTNPIVIDGKDHIAAQGCVVFYKDGENTKEFVFNGTKWELLGSDLTYKVVQSAVSSPNANGNAVSFIDTISQDANGVITATKKDVRSATTGQTGVVKLNNTVTSTSTSEAATAKAVKTAYDKGAEALTVANSKWTAVDATTSVKGIVTLQEGDLSGVKSTSSGVAASSYHTHSQYLTSHQDISHLATKQEVEDNEEVTSNALNVLNTSISELENTVVKTTSQSLSDTEKNQVKENLGLHDTMLNVTYLELKSLRDTSKLVPGQQYRITDYVTTTTQSNTQSAGHPFDIIVTADDVNVLNEKARAIQHTNDENDYFHDSNLATWELKYCIDNDTNRFAWGDDSDNGRGVIYYMKDEWNNECPYDFKNIQFARWELSNPVGYTKNTSNQWVEDSKVTETYGPLKVGFYGRENTNNEFTFGDNNFKLEYTTSAEPTYCYTFGNGSDYSLTGENFDNVIKENLNSNKQIQLNNIVFLGNWCIHNTFEYFCCDNTFGNTCNNNTFGDSCFYNTFGDGCTHNTFGDGCYSNTFGNDCVDNTFGNDCIDNTFGDGCYSNTFGGGCTHNTFGDGCYYNTFGDACVDNTFGNNCDSNTLGNYCVYNTFGDNCNSNTLGNYCGYNTLGNYCGYNTFGESKNSPKSYYRYIIFDNGNRYINLNCTSTTTNINYFQNVRIGLGVNNTDTYKTINDSNVGQTYETLYKPANSQTITI